MSKFFCLNVWQKVRLIPKGKITTYKLLAQAIGRPKSVRVIGQILKKNPYLVKIPCHRVVRSDGLVGGYIKGVKKKLGLLKKEGLKIERLKTKNQFKIKNFKNYLFKF